MKKTIVFTIMLAWVFCAMAQDHDREILISSEQFETQVRTLRIPGFSGRPLFEHEEEGYQAVFMQGNEVFVINLEARHYPPTWMGSPIQLDGLQAEFTVMGGMGMLIIDLPAAYAVLSLVSNKLTEQSALERIARETGFLGAAPASEPWPSRIPAAYRLRGVLLEASEGRDYDAGFSYQVRVSLVMGSELRASLMEMVARYGDEGGFLNLPNGMILNLPFSDLEDMDDLYVDHDLVQFIYYIP